MSISILATVAIVEDRVELHRDMARRMYEPQVNGYEVGNVDASNAGWTADGEIREPYELTLFSPKRGDWTVTLSSPGMDSNPEFRMYWKGIPDYGIEKYDVWPLEEGWIARLVYAGTARDGEHVVAHEVDIVTTDEQERVVRLEWYVDQEQWLQVWAKASGKTVDEVRAMVVTLDGWQQFLAEANAS
jgi:hypothetical protein